MAFTMKSHLTVELFMVWLYVIFERARRPWSY